MEAMFSFFYLHNSIIINYTFQYNKIIKWIEDVWNEDFWSTDGLPATCATAFRYSNLSETTNGPKKGKNIP